MFAIPTKLPMIQVKPKDLYSKSLGGYLFNEVEYKEYLFIEKKALKVYLKLCDTESKTITLFNNINII